MYSKEQDTLELLQQLEKSLERLSAMESRLDRWAILLEKIKIDDLIQNYSNPKRLIYINLLSGVARGLGLTIGTTLVVAILGYILTQFIDLPIIGEYIANLLDIIDINRDINRQY